MNSAFYRGRVRHERTAHKKHVFQYSLQLAYVDLDELPNLFRGRWFWSVEGRTPISFRRADYLGSPTAPLREEVLDRVEAELGRRPSGSVGILTQLRTFGYVFNPVSFYFCHDADGELDAIVAEITNTPWGERHAYVLDAAAQPRDADAFAFRFDKDFHVSPFFDMDQVYEWRFTRPGRGLAVEMKNYERGRLVFRVSMSCARHAITGRSLASGLLRFPLQPLRLHAAIYWQAARLFLKRTPFFTHPSKRPTIHDAPVS